MYYRVKVRVVSLSLGLLEIFQKILNYVYIRFSIEKPRILQTIASSYSKYAAICLTRHGTRYNLSARP